MVGNARSRGEEAALHVRTGKLTAEDRRQIAGMLARGDRIQDVAYWFGVSPSTVHKVKVGSQGSWTLTDAAAALLPPRGPYAIVEKRIVVEFDKVRAERDAAAIVITELEGLLLRYKTLANMGQIEHTTQLKVGARQ